MQTYDPASDPILCDPYREPDRHWVLDTSGRALPNRPPARGRRPSLRARPVPKDKKLANVQQEWDLGIAEQNQNVEDIRSRVETWRSDGYPGVTGVTRKLLFHWSEEDQCQMPPFFAQREAIETLIWLREVATRGTAERRAIEEISRRHNDGIVRYASKMATGSGKTAVMAMLIAWQTLNAVGTTRTRNLRHAQRFVVITPGLTVRERLEVLKPNHPDNIYDEMGLIPVALRSRLNQARVKIINYQAFVRRDDLDATGAARKLLRVDPEHRREDHVRAAERVLRELIRGAAYGDIVVINDEAHHCWLPEAPTKAKKDEKEAAAVWFNAIRALRDAGHLGRRAAGGGQESVVYDFSATPMWIGTSAAARPRLFEWVVSDFPLMDAIESGLVKVPRVPIDDDSLNEQTMWRNLYSNTVPKKVNALEDHLQEPLDSSVKALYNDYERTFAAWEDKLATPPVMIVVANSIQNAEGLFEWIAGHGGGEGPRTPGRLALFSNVDEHGNWHAQPRTILVHSQIDQDKDLTPKIAGLAKEQVERYAEYTRDRQKALRLRAMKPGEALRLMMNTVGKEGQPGEQVRCVVSVSMLTEGWDVRTVTHVLGYRAFSTQLLCEQVTGRALRRSSYQSWREEQNGRRRLKPEYAEVVGVPFEFMPNWPPKNEPIQPPPTHVVESVPGRDKFRINFPQVEEYLRVPPRHPLRLDPDRVQPYTVQPDLFPTSTVLTGVTGEEKFISISDDTRRGTVRATLAARMVRSFVNGDDPEAQSRSRTALFRDLYRATGEWLDHPEVSCPDPILLLGAEHYQKVSTAILNACTDTEDRERERERAWSGDLTVKLGQPAQLDTGSVYFETTLQWIYPPPKIQTDLSGQTPTSLGPLTHKSELNRAACHSALERACAEHLDNHPKVQAWARNFGLGWTVPYHFQGVWRSYHPDFVARLTDGSHLIVECKGLPDDKSEATKEYVTDWWMPAVAGTPGLPHRRWGFVELISIPLMSHQLDKAINRLLSGGEP